MEVRITLGNNSDPSGPVQHARPGSLQEGKDNQDAPTATPLLLFLSDIRLLSHPCLLQTIAKEYDLNVLTQFKSIASLFSDISEERSS